MLTSKRAEKAWRRFRYWMQTAWSVSYTHLDVYKRQVQGYQPRDGVKHLPFTTLEGIVAKETGAEPFNSPQALLDAVKARRYGGLEDKRLGSVPVNYLADLDITGGNSGSPVLDAVSYTHLDVYKRQ